MLKCGTNEDQFLFVTIEARETCQMSSAQENLIFMAEQGIQLVYENNNKKKMVTFEVIRKRSE